jgi:hypothetical protein
MRSRAFRAGGAAGIAPLFTGPVTLLADISEFQPDIADAAYLAWSKAIVIRAAYGDAHDDAAWYGGARRDALHAGGARFLGIYQYIAAGQDPAAQAGALVSLLGPMRPGEKIIADIEEGDGDQQARWAAWANVIHAELGDTPWDYSGLDFAAGHGLQPVDWVADYGTAEPAAQHKLWQFTDSYAIPGAGTADCSLYRGTIDELAALGWQGRPAAVPAAQASVTVTLPVLGPGSTDASLPHEYVRRVQVLANGIFGASPALAGDGSYGAATQAAVKKIQQQAGLTADGITGPLTWSLLISGTA